jgi:UDPglucose--hexose-1-phosphate uridylyltransferase
VVVAPGRARRPGAGAAQIPPADQEELDGCPFCEGREDRTPPETLALGRDGQGPDTPGWTVRVVPNLYPAFERQEVVVHSPRHARTFAELSEEETTRVAEAWRSRADSARADGFGYVHALVNEGRAAGASLPHSHSQLVWLREEPPAVTGERTESCGLCGEADSGLVVAERDGLMLRCPAAGRVPYELLLAPREHDGDGFQSSQLPAALALLAEGIRRLRAVEGPVPWNAWLHVGDHWHVEIVPRLTVFAGIELGAGIYVNTLAPEDAAAALREAQATSS